MKRFSRTLIACSAVVLTCLAIVGVLVFAGAALAGQEPYVAVVGDDTSIPDFYISPKLKQFTHPNTHPPAYEDKEHFVPPQPLIHPERCEVEEGAVPTNPNARIHAYNAGHFQWHIVLPKKPQGNLNIVIQCGILKPEEIDILHCAGETGERQGPGECNRAFDEVGRNPVMNEALPTIKAQAEPGPYATDEFVDPFHLTAYRNPSMYGFPRNADGWLEDARSLQVLDGSTGTRFALKACMDKSIFVKIPVSGQINAEGQTEYDLEAGDRIWVEVKFPRGHTMDVYCHAQSVRIQGIGDPFSLLP